MISRRRLTLQLTPLLDLMLIVMFSQHLAYKQQNASEQQALQQRQQTLTAQLQSRETELAQQQASLNNQYLETARLLSSLLSPTQNSQLAEQLENFPEVRQTLQQQINTSPDGAARFLNRVSAMQKHVTIWEIHLLDSGRAELHANQLTESTDFDSPDEFAERLFLASKRIDPAPHSLTIVLLSWGDTQLRPRNNATKGIETLVQKLRTDAAGIRWYDFSVTGYRPDGSLTDSAPQNPKP
jgi:hypothetical protein